MVLGVAGRQCAAAPGAVSGVGAKSGADCTQTSLRQRFRWAIGYRGGRFAMIAKIRRFKVRWFFEYFAEAVEVR